MPPPSPPLILHRLEKVFLALPFFHSYNRGVRFLVPQMHPPLPPQPPKKRHSVYVPENYFMYLFLFEIESYVYEIDFTLGPIQNSH